MNKGIHQDLDTWTSPRPDPFRQTSAGVWDTYYILKSTTVKRMTKTNTIPGDCKEIIIDEVSPPRISCSTCVEKMSTSHLVTHLALSVHRLSSNGKCRWPALSQCNTQIQPEVGEGYWQGRAEVPQAMAF